MTGSWTGQNQEEEEEKEEAITMSVWTYVFEVKGGFLVFIITHRPHFNDHHRPM